MEEKYTFEMMWEDLNNGYQIFYTYVRNRYLLFKTAPNCYTQKLLTEHKKNPQPKMSMLTLKRGYSIVKKDNKVIDKVKTLKSGDNITIELQDGKLSAVIK